VTDENLLNGAEIAPHKQQRGTGRRLHGSIANWLGAAILSGKYPPGTTLSGEIEFSETLDVSRSVYREAVKVLIAKGLVESRTKTGTRVLPREHWNLLDPEVLSWALAGEPDLDFIRNIFELRAIIEPAAAALAAQRRSRDEVKKMKKALAEMTRHTLATDAGRAADQEFHDTILRATRNDAVIVLTSSIGAAVHWTTLFKQRAGTLPRNPIPDHNRVYEAIAAGDPEAARAAMHALIELAHEDTRQLIQARAEKGPERQ